MNHLDVVNLTKLLTLTEGKSEIKVGLIDGPVVTSHPDLEGGNIFEVPGKQGTCASAGSVACIHGTFVAGILSGKRGSQSPSICPGCTLLVCPIFTEETQGQVPSASPKELAEAISECIESGARLINLSVALTQLSKGQHELEEALDYAANQDVIAVAAAGNQGTVGSSVITHHPWVIPVGHYRMIGGFDQADGTIYPTLSINDLVKSSLTLADLVAKSSLSSYLDRPSPFLRCGALGEACCRAPTALQNIPAFGPLVSCQQGLGCDITTNKCVSTCGGPGQVCCDGPETRALKWTADGKVYSPNYWNMREMCDKGTCDRQTHRCITCGTQNGGPCCSSDAAQATARCFRDAKTGNRLVCNDSWAGAGGICVECGKSGQPKCLTAGEAPCDNGLVERESDGICVPCGSAGQPTCDRGEPCRGGHSAPDRWFSECVAAGGPNQPCRPDGGCDFQGFCNNSRICQPCGQPGEICCPPGRLPGNAACQQSSECRDNRCFACGYDNMPICSSGSPCHSLSEPVDGWCRPCGKEGQGCCQSSTIITRCLDGMCDDGVCRRPPPPPPPPPQGQLKTCNGEDWGLSTMERTVFIKHAANQCIDEVTYKANSAQEAYTCARRDWGNDAVVTETIDLYKFALTSQFGCHTVTVWGTDESGAQTCAQSQCINCTVTPGDCP